MHEEVVKGEEAVAIKTAVKIAFEGVTIKVNGKETVKVKHKPVEIRPQTVVVEGEEAIEIKVFFVVIIRWQRRASPCVLIALVDRSNLGCNA